MSGPGTVRRRLRHDDVGGEHVAYERGERSDQAEPLLADDDHDAFDHSPPLLDFAARDAPNADDNKYKVRRRGERQAWITIFKHVVAQWAVFFGSLVAGTGAVLGTLGGSVFHLLTPPKGAILPLPLPLLSPVQESRLRHLQARLRVPFDKNNEEHQEALRALWRAAYPEEKLEGMVSEQWKKMGWQGTDPSTDFRGGGFISLENLLHFAYKYPRAFRRLLRKEQGRRAEWEYPFAVAGLNITFMLVQLVDLRSEPPRTSCGRRFLSMLEDDENAFEELYCMAFQMLDVQWLSMGASYMEFNAVMAATRAQLEQALSMEGGPGGGGGRAGAAAAALARRDLLAE